MCAVSSFEIKIVPSMYFYDRHHAGLPRKLGGKGRKGRGYPNSKKSVDVIIKKGGCNFFHFSNFK
jgi:hypothetical protein